MKNHAIANALTDLQRTTGIVIDPRQEADARAVLGALFDSGHEAGVASVPVPGTEDGKLSAEEIGAIRSLVRVTAAANKKAKK